MHKTRRLCLGPTGGTIRFWKETSQNVHVLPHHGVGIRPIFRHVFASFMLLMTTLGGMEFLDGSRAPYGGGYLQVSDVTRWRIHHHTPCMLLLMEGAFDPQKRLETPDRRPRGSLKDHETPQRGSFRSSRRKELSLSTVSCTTGSSTRISWN